MPSQTQFVGTGANDASVGTVAWSSPTSITSDNGTNATFTSGAATSNYLKGTNCGFTIPSGATIDGIVVTIERGYVAGDATDSEIKIVKNGIICSANKSTGATWSSSMTVVTYGSASDLWSEYWNYTDINSSNFGAVLSISTTGVSPANVDYISITVYYTEASGDGGSGIHWVDAFMTFRSVAIPKNVTINKAFVRFTAKAGTLNVHVIANDEDSVKTMIFGNYVDDSSPPTDITSYTDKVLTSNCQEWQNITNWTDEVTYDTPDISCIIQEIVDRSGWISGNDISIYVQNNFGTEFENDDIGRRAYDYGTDNAKAPQLFVYYTMDEVMDGGVVCGGTASHFMSISISGGVVCAGSASSLKINWPEISGGAICAGTGSIVCTYNVSVVPAGLVAGDSAHVSHITSTPSVGGVTCDGSHIRGIFFNPQATEAALIIFRQPSPRISNNRLGANVLSPHFNGIHHWWSCDYAGGRFVYDVVRGATGTISGSSAANDWSTDPVRGTKVLNLPETDYVTVPGVTILDGTSKFTLMARVQLLDVNESRSFFSKMLDQTGFSIGWDAGSGFVVHIYNGANERGYTGTLNYTTGIWYQVCVVYDGTQSSNSQRLKIFVDGIQNTLSFFGTIPSTVSANSSNLLIGAGRANWLGLLDDIRLYNRALRSSEIVESTREQYPTQLRLQQIVGVYTEVVVNSGLVCNGDILEDSTLNVADGGGGVRGSGSANVSFVYNLPIVPNGVTISGLWDSQVIFIPTGGCVVSGSHDLTTNFITLGGIRVDGHIQLNGIWNEPRLNEPIEGVFVLGDPLINSLKETSYVSDGNIIEISGEMSGGMTGSNSGSDGGITVSGDTTIVNFAFNKSITFPWVTRTRISKDVTLVWNVGQLKIFWYRVISKPLTADTCALQDCCQKYNITIHARTIAELCSKLSRRKFKFPIESIEKFSRPAENSELRADEANGIDHVCQTLTPVEFCTVPECADFCIDYDLRQNVKFVMTLQMNAFFDTEGSGSAYTGGSAGASYTTYIPDLPYVADGGLTLSGTTTYQVNHYAGRGGMVLSGTASIASNRHSFVGGQWPDVISDIFPNRSVTEEDSATDVAWQLVERVRYADSLFSQADISFGKRSEYLKTSEFGFSLPSDANILGLIVRIDRVATQIGIRDLGVFLVRGNQFVSDNLANTTLDWPMIQTERSYGSDGLNGGTVWRDPDSSNYLGPLTVDDLNDPTFGVAIRVIGRQSLPTAIAKINYINIEIFYEDSNGSIVRMGGECLSRAPSYHYQSTGKTTPNSVSICKAGFRYVPNGLNSAGQALIQIGGVGANGFYYVGTGGSRLSGEAKVTPYLEVPSGGLRASGLAKVTPYFETGIGGARVAGKALRSNKIHYVTSGGPILSSLTFAPQVELSAIADGSVVLGSTSRIRSSVWQYATDGSVIEVNGEAVQRPGDFFTQLQEIGFDMVILDVSATFAEDEGIQDTIVLTNSLSRCGCTNMPLTIELTQNLTTNNILSQFLFRNNYVASRQLKLRYNATNDSWQCNLHYRGRSAEDNTPESWDLTFELSCTDVVGGISIGMSIWKIAVQVHRKNLVTRQSYETRVLVGLLPNKICGSVGNELDFDIIYNTQINLATVKPNATVYQNTLYDNIGLFKNRAWIENPDLFLTLSQSSSTKPQTRIDLTEPVLSP